VRKSFGAALIYVAALGFSSRIEAQESSLPGALKNDALAVRIEAVVEEGGPAASAPWHSGSLRYTVPGTPTAVKLVSSNAVIVVQVTPFDDGKNGLILVTQGQVWVRQASGDLSYRTTLNTVSVRYGEKVYFFPFGRDLDGRSPLRLTIVVERYLDTPEGKVPREALPSSPPPSGPNETSPLPPAKPDQAPGAQGKPFH
jgi:hypothetical protein